MHLILDDPGQLSIKLSLRSSGHSPIVGTILYASPNFPNVGGATKCTNVLRVHDGTVQRRHFTMCTTQASLEKKGYHWPGTECCVTWPLFPAQFALDIFSSV